MDDKNIAKKNNVLCIPLRTTHLMLSSIRWNALYFPLPKSALEPT